MICFFAADSASESDSEEDTWFADVSEEAQRLRKNAEFADVRQAKCRFTEFMQFVQSQMKPLHQKLDEIMAAADSAAAGGESDPVVLLRQFLASKERTTSDIVGEVRRLQMARGFDESKKMRVLLEGLIDTSKIDTVLVQLKKTSPVLQALVRSGPGKYFCTFTFSFQGTTSSLSAKLFMSALEEWVGVTEPKLLPKFAHILQV